MQRLTGCVFAISLALLLHGCTTQTAKSTATAVGIPAPSGSPLSKIDMGMNKKQVGDILGRPDDQNSYPTGKAWIPFYFGNDARRTSWYYEGVGRVVFADGNIFGGGTAEVIRVDYDPSESGIAR